MEVKKELGFIFGQINQNMKENGVIIVLMDMEYIIIEIIRFI